LPTHVDEDSVKLCRINKWPGTKRGKDERDIERRYIVCSIWVWALHTVRCVWQCILSVPYECELYTQWGVCDSAYCLFHMSVSFTYSEVCVTVHILWV
jgi:hypothetical protein